MAQLHEDMYLLLQSRDSSMLGALKPLKNGAIAKSDALFQSHARFFLVDFPS